MLKQPLGMTSILVLLPHWSSVSHGSCFYFFQNFHIFKNIFNQHFYETRRNPNKLFVYLRDDWMFSQHWAHADGIGPALGRQSVLQVCPPVSWLWDTNYPPISGDCSDLTVWYVGICDGKCLILLTCFVYMAIYDLEIQLFRSFSVL